uniref:Uncharacterized protein n=1 Tax=Anguilla anguilla TaxID=7936 RepID=A0A0E9WH09_ANGAN
MVNQFYTQTQLRGYNGFHTNTDFTSVGSVSSTDESIQVFGVKIRCANF